MVRTINKIRHSYGLPGLKPAYSLFVSAKVYSRHMMRSDYFGHMSRIPVASRWKTAGEALAWHSGWRLSPRQTVWQWMGSPPHRALLLSSRFSRIGVGRARGRYAGRAATMWTAHFGHR